MAQPVLSPFQPYGNDLPALVEKVNQVLLYGRMPDAMKQVLVTAAAPGYDAKTRIETVLYLTALTDAERHSLHLQRHRNRPRVGQPPF